MIHLNYLQGAACTKISRVCHTKYQRCGKLRPSLEASRRSRIYQSPVQRISGAAHRNSQKTKARFGPAGLGWAKASSDENLPQVSRK